MDTIFALSSAPGKAGVSVVRVSGPLAFQSLAVLTGLNNPTPRQATLRSFCDPDSAALIDRVLVMPFRSPASFTGEDVIEYHFHGSTAIITAALEILGRQQGHRLAEPGEFTRRAFENEKVDLTEAEAIGDLINAETEAQRIQALAQMNGGLSKLYNGWREKLIRASAYIEAVIDFPDEDVPDSETLKVLPELHALRTDIQIHLNDGRRGERLRNGIQIAVVGAPNAGKSSLVNALAQRDVAIVSPVAGTTRDIIEVHLDLGGYPVILADTAGLRPDQIVEDGNQGSIESEGIKRALDRAKTADFKLIVFDGQSVTPDPHSMALVDDRSLVVVNKVDKDSQYDDSLWPKPFTAISVKENTLDPLLDVLRKIIQDLCAVSRETPSLTRIRHRAAVVEALDCIDRALIASLPELMAEDLRMASRALGRITGRVDVEDLLDVIFKDFCIGK